MPTLADNTGFYFCHCDGCVPYLTAVLATPPVANEVSASSCVFLLSVYPRGHSGNMSVWLAFLLLALDIFNSSIQMLLSGPWFTSLSPVYSLSFYLYDRAFHKAKVGPLLLLFGCIHHLTVAQPAWNLWDGSL